MASLGVTPDSIEASLVLDGDRRANTVFLLSVTNLTTLRFSVAADYPTFVEDSYHLAFNCR